MINFKQWLTLNETTTPEQIEQILTLYHDPQTIEKALNQHTGVIKYIAHTLNIHQTTIRRILKKHGITKDPITRSQLTAQLWQNPEHRAKTTENQWSTPEQQKIYDQILDTYNDPTTIEKALNQHTGVITYIAHTLNISRYTVERILQKHGITQEPLTTAQIAAQQWHNPEKREKLSQQQIQRWQDPEYQTKTSQSMSITRSTPEEREKLSQRIKTAWQNPITREKMLNKPSFNDFWNWINTFPPEKQTQILKAMHAAQNP